MRWAILALAITGEIIGTMQIGISEGFAKNAFKSCMIVTGGYGVSLTCLSILIRLKLIELSAVYAVWVALGVAIVSFLSTLWLREAMPPLKVFCLLLIVTGTVGLILLEGGY